MNLRAIDLNLLVLLQALLEEGHVSRAARRVGLSQPAMSNALDRCRELFGDRLLERDGAVMRLTPRGEALRKPLASVLRDLAVIVDQPEPSLAEVTRTVRIVAADLVAAVLLPPLRDAVAALAPGVTLSFRGWEGGGPALAQLANGSVDLVISVLTSAEPARFVSEPVCDVAYVLAMRSTHPVAAQADAVDWLEYPHLIVSTEGATRTAVDDLLAERGLNRRVGVTIPSFLLVPDVLRSSDVLALVPSLCVAGDRGIGLAVREPPVSVPGFRLDVARHRRTHGDLAVDFVASQIRSALDGKSGAQA